MRWLKKHGGNVFLILVMALGIGLLVYPAASDYWNTLHQSRALDNYMDSVQEIPFEDYSDMLEEARAYNARLAARQEPLQSDEEALDEYNRILNPAGNGILGYIEIKKIGVRLPVYHGTEDNVLQVAAGHLFATSFPVGGKGTHACMSGHTGLPKAMLFTDLTELTDGDLFTVQVLNELLTYEVDQVKIVEPHDVSDLAIDPEQDYVTLITCTPYGVNSHRLLVRGHRVPNLPEDEEMLQEQIIAADGAVLLNPGIIGVCLAILVLAATGLVLTWHHKKKGGTQS